MSEYDYLQRKNRLKELRTSKNLTLRELGKEVGMRDNTLSQYENGKREPKFETWQKLADYFDVSIGFIRGYGFSRSEIKEITYKALYQALKLGILNKKDDLDFFEKDLEKLFRRIKLSNLVESLNLKDAIVKNNKIIPYSKSKLLLENKFDDYLDDRFFDDMSNASHNAFEIKMKDIVIGGTTNEDNKKYEQIQREIASSYLRIKLWGKLSEIGFELERKELNIISQKYKVDFPTFLKNIQINRKLESLMITGNTDKAIKLIEDEIELLKSFKEKLNY